MEDAMILNKSAAERHFGYGSIIKCESIDLMDFRTPNQPMTLEFGIGEKEDLLGKIDIDGLPIIGSRVEQGDPICAYVNTATGKVSVKKYKSTETGYIEEVKLLGNDAGDAPCTKIVIKYRIPRPPIIGDKFSSRHGQKGVCSTRFPTVDLPFSESGIVPDVIINPHAFPSRMTIGMLIESLAGKSGALHGMAYDSTPFKSV
jgi:DNA-directed RNA polymerase I subunit RPA2